MTLPVLEFIRFGRDICGDLRQAERREWPLFTNRWGGGAIAPQAYPDIESFPAGKPHAGVDLCDRRSAPCILHVHGARRRHNIM
jgi:hypothetical protein